MRLLERTIMTFVRLFVCLSVTGVHCDHTLHVSAHFKFMVGYSNFLGPLTPKHVHVLLAVFFQFHLEKRWVWMFKLRVIS